MPVCIAVAEGRAVTRCGSRSVFAILKAPKPSIDG